ncbi:hypothetical protein IFM61606_05598 [Aspergillus udagawae]|uniref:Uncharacterized protein n=1 Tax=Aspergillus udagawae TaxID=91492 RepID=A0ABQ1AIC5_9EURO|nr:hypothetical protein IFM51744_04526 [Aspergillus udagawae]GFF82438.1 hypothetical protein IFM53868_03468 [Aspergillus udagawae]GFG03750.1 hypothetical protein IFM5058_01585 [Aspergillus udagawae]GFG25648.1 hypothetical protein IFM61606_05598 [Aspergillus udagawae]
MQPVVDGRFDLRLEVGPLAPIRVDQYQATDCRLGEIQNVNLPENTHPIADIADVVLAQGLGCRVLCDVPAVLHSLGTGPRGLHLIGHRSGDRPVGEIAVRGAESNRFSQEPSGLVADDPSR